MMFLAKVTKLSEVQLAPNCILVELVKRESNIILAGADGKELPTTTEFIKVEVIKSESEKINTGDLILDTRSGAMTYSGYHEVDGKFYAVITEHDIKAWISPVFYDKNKK